MAVRCLTPASTARCSSSADGTQRVVLRDIAFSIAHGEVIALLGPSGIGKSTTLRILLGLDEAFEGRIRRGDSRIGVMFQEPRLLPWLTVVAESPPGRD